MSSIKFLNLQSNKYLSSFVKEVFKKNIEPLYDDQTNAVKKILESIDRNCDIFFVNDEPKGLIVYKTSLQNELGLKNAFELKTLLLFEPSKDRGYGIHLLHKAEELARDLKAECLYGSISKNTPRILKYLKKQGWSELDTTKDENVTWVLKKLRYE